MEAISKALEQESCEDAISRQAVLDATVKRNSIWNKITNSKGENLEEIISQLPPVTLQQKTGNWIVYKGCEGKTRRCKCDRCGYETGDYTWTNPNFCSNCGIKMESEE